MQRGLVIQWMIHSLDMIRRRTVRFVKTVLILFFLTLLWLQLHIMNGTRGNSNPTVGNSVTVVHPPETPPSQSDPLVRYVNGLIATELSLRNLSANSTLIHSSINGSINIRLAIAIANNEEKVLNVEKFGPLEQDAVIVVIQVHTRINYLRYLISSFKTVQGIEKILLIFSHDVYDPEINTLIQSIDFCMVLQIFYPFSLQLHEKNYPGQDPFDCPRDIKKPQAVKIRCKNANYPDLYGHYREAKFSQTKHHWWWKINRVFDGLTVTRNHTGLMVFLEEDHYVAEDFLHILRLMDETRKKTCKECKILSLGNYMKTVNFAVDSRKAEIWQWFSSKHNMGMAFGRSTWVDLKKCAKKFCYFDDYNWDWSLQYISATCLPHKLDVMFMKAPRVFHIGECGVHHKKKDCNSNAELNKTIRTLRLAVPHLFPTKLIVTHSTKRSGKMPRGNGGWGDLRDHLLCMWHTNITSIRIASSNIVGTDHLVLFANALKLPTVG